MGWATYGTDSRGRPIGYAFAAICDFPECTTEIRRGLAHACGGMHGDGDGYQCEKYFCAEHLKGRAPDGAGRVRLVCDDCEKQWREEKPFDAWWYDRSGDLDR